MKRVVTLLLCLVFLCGCTASKEYDAGFKAGYKEGFDEGYQFGWTDYLNNLPEDKLMEYMWDHRNEFAEYWYNRENG